MNTYDKNPHIPSPDHRFKLRLDRMGILPDPVARSLIRELLAASQHHRASNSEAQGCWDDAEAL